MPCLNRPIGQILAGFVSLEARETPIAAIPRGSKLSTIVIFSDHPLVFCSFGPWLPSDDLISNKNQLSSLTGRSKSTIHGALTGL